MNEFKVFTVSFFPIIPVITIVTVESIVAIFSEEPIATVASITETSIEASIATLLRFIEITPIIAPTAAVASVRPSLKAASCIPEPAIATTALEEALISSIWHLLLLRFLHVIEILAVLMVFVNLMLSVNLLIIVAKRFFFDLSFLLRLFMDLLWLSIDLMILLGLLFLLINRWLDMLLLNLLCMNIHKLWNQACLGLHKWQHRHAERHLAYH